jgi:hypothetical protein
VKLTARAADVDERDLEALRAEGLDDAAISDAIQVIGVLQLRDARRRRRRDRGRAGVGMKAQPLR